MPFPNKLIALQRFLTSRQLLPGDWANSITDALFSAQSLLATGGTQAAAAQANAAQVELLTGAAAGVKLPPAYPGAEVTILNNSGNTATVYGTGTDTVQTTGTTYAASVTMATLTCAVFRCVKAGFWQRIITA